ncbi:MAG: sulfatase [Acidobacteriota bacterium]|nr:sulfatase [Acidobacteriota bacterium]
MRFALQKLFLLPLFLHIVACSPRAAEDAPGISLPPTRGYVLISLDTLGADHLGAYSAAHDTSPFLDEFASRGVLFENALAQYPSTLVSHVSIFTGLYPREHGVYVPSSVLSLEIDTLPEHFRRHGFRTAGHTEGGYVCTDLGFNRGFDEFVDRQISSDTDIEKTFERGLDFLRSLESDERFFLFLHSYAIHDPYDPPEPFRPLHLSTDSADLPPSEGGYLRDINMRRREVSADTVARYHELYDGTVRYVDSVLESFFAELDLLGLRDEVTIIITSDHGEEFFEHGRLSHSQVYPETLRVPLLILHPSKLSGTRVGDLVRLIDVAPTLYELAGIPSPEPISGRSLVPLFSASGKLTPVPAFAEMVDLEQQQALFTLEDGQLLQYVVAERLSEADGTWVAKEAVFDTAAATVDLELVSFGEPREITMAIDGRDDEAFIVGTDWTPKRLQLGPTSSSHRVRLSTSGCDVPLWLGWGNDSRCLSFKVRGISLRRTELFDLSKDATATHDISSERAELTKRLAGDLAQKRWTLVAEPGSRSPTSDTEQALRALGYLQ